MIEYSLVRERVLPNEHHLGGYSLSWEDPREFIDKWVVEKGKRGFVAKGSWCGSDEYVTQEDADIAAYRAAVCEGLEIVELNTTQEKRCRIFDRTNNPSYMKPGGRRLTKLPPEGIVRANIDMNDTRAKEGMRAQLIGLREYVNRDVFIEKADWRREEVGTRKEILKTVILPYGIATANFGSFPELAFTSFLSPESAIVNISVQTEGGTTEIYRNSMLPQDPRYVNPPGDWDGSCWSEPFVYVDIVTGIEMVEGSRLGVRCGECLSYTLDPEKTSDNIRKLAIGDKVLGVNFVYPVLDPLGEFPDAKTWDLFTSDGEILHPVRNKNLRPNDK